MPFYTYVSRVSRNLTDSCKVVPRSARYDISGLYVVEFMTDRTLARPAQALFSLLTLFLAHPALAERADYDLDGISDQILVRELADAEGTLRWSVRESSTGKRVKIADIGVDGDHRAPAKWLDQGIEQVGVIRRISEEEGAQLLLPERDPIELPSYSATYLTGADFDGSGQSDIAAVEAGDDGLEWTMIADPSSEDAQASAPIQFGGASDQPFYAAVGGENDWIGVKREVDGAAQLYLMNTLTQDTSIITLPAALKRFDAPKPIKLAGGETGYLFALDRNNWLRIVIVNGSGERVFRRSFPRVERAIVGEYLNALDGEEIALTRKEGALIFNPANLGSLAILRIRRGEIVDTVGNFAAPPPSADPEENPDVPSLEGCSAVNPEDGAGLGFVWKPNSDTTYYAVAVMPGTLSGKVKQVDVYTQEGALIKNLQLTGCGNPDPNGPRCNYKDFALTGANYKNQYGSIVLKVSKKGGTCATYFISDPSKRVD